MYGETQALGKLPKQSKGVSALNNEQPWPIDGSDLHQDVVQHCRLAGAGWPEQEEMGVHLAIQTIERIDGYGLPAPVEEGDARMSGATASAPGGPEICDMLCKEQPRIDFTSVERGIEI